MKTLHLLAMELALAITGLDMVHASLLPALPLHPTVNSPQGHAMNTLDTVLYTGKTHIVGGREGHARSDDGQLDVALSPPGSQRPGTNPEQLLGAGWSACFEGAMKIAARRFQIAMPADTAIDAEVDLGKVGDAFQLQARLNVSLPGLDPVRARLLVDEAHRTCPYSRATRGNIDVQITLA